MTLDEHPRCDRKGSQYGPPDGVRSQELPKGLLEAGHLLGRCSLHVWLGNQHRAARESQEGQRQILLLMLMYTCQVKIEMRAGDVILS